MKFSIIATGRLLIILGFLNSCGDTRLSHSLTLESGQAAQPENSSEVRTRGDGGSRLFREVLRPPVDYEGYYQQRRRLELGPSRTYEQSPQQ